MSVAFPPEGFICLLKGKVDTSLSASLLRHSHDPEIKITDNPFSSHDVEKTNKRLIKILESLAAISVCDFRQGNVNGSFIAVAMSDSEGLAKYQLYVAANGTVPQTVITHLKFVWTKLQEIKDSLQDLPGDFPRRMPPHLTPPTTSNLIALEVKMYTHSMPKFKTRFQKWENAFQNKFMPALDAYVRNPETPTQFNDADYQKIRKLSSTFKKIGAILESDSINTERLEMLTAYVAGVGQEWESHLKHQGGLLLLCDGVLEEKESLKPFSLRRYLEKVLTLRNHFETLTQIPLSDRFAPFLNRSLDVIPVPADQRSLTIDISIPSLRGIVRPAMDKEDNDNDVDDVADAFREKMFSATKIDGKLPDFISKDKQKLEFTNTPVHCECGLLAYLHKNRIPAYSFIGVSKLSCYGCHMFFEAYNTSIADASHPAYYTRGTHSKVYAPWVAPLLDRIGRGVGPSDAKIRSRMQTLLLADFQTFVKKSMRADSDSTTHSGDSVRPFSSIPEFTIRRVDDADAKWERVMNVNNR